eukprot:6412773-Alexandrium_andersonii.AAC.1
MPETDGQLSRAGAGLTNSGERCYTFVAAHWVCSLGGPHSRRRSRTNCDCCARAGPGAGAPRS